MESIRLRTNITGSMEVSKDSDSYEFRYDPSELFAHRNIKPEKLSLSLSTDLDQFMETYKASIVRTFNLNRKITFTVWDGEN